MKARTVGPWSLWGTLAMGLVLMGMPQSVDAADDAVLRPPPTSILRLPSDRPTPPLSVDVPQSPQPALHNLVVPAPAASSVTGPSAVTPPRLTPPPRRLEVYAMADTSVVVVEGVPRGGSGFERLRRALPYGVSHQPVIRYLSDGE